MTWHEGPDYSNPSSDHTNSGVNGPVVSNQCGSRNVVQPTRRISTAQGVALSNCPKFINCNAPICPLDPGWSMRTHIKNEPVCFYLCEYVKPCSHRRFREGIEVHVYQAICQILQPLLSRHAPLQKALKRAKQTSSRMAARRSGARPDGRERK